MPFEAGTKLGRYEIRSKLGEGGMGEVYRARDEKLNRDVAIKVLPTQLLQNGDRLHRFEQEAHRDLKPDNLFINTDDHVKILDFGLAKLIQPPAEEISRTDVATRKVHTDPGTIMGAAGYMAPEQVRGRPVDHRADIFSFGAVFYKMLSGRRAFKRESAETLNAILKEEPAELTSTEPLK